MIIVPYELKHIKYNCILNILTFSPLAPEAPTAPGCPTSPCKDKQQVPVLINEAFKLYLSDKDTILFYLKH